MESELRWLYTVLVSLSASPVLGSSNLHAYAHYHEDETMIRRPSPMYDNWDSYTHSCTVQAYINLFEEALGATMLLRLYLARALLGWTARNPGLYTRLLLETQFAVVAGNPSLELIHGGA
ncbi:hypothetical protein AB1N83_007306 [Pleurotus pulmonarius]